VIRSRKFIYYNQNFNTLFWGSALTDQMNQANHIIDWKKTTVIDREQDRPTRWIKEAVHIRREGHQAMNGDEGSYQLSHANDRLLDATADRHIKTRKNWVPASSDKDLVMRSKHQNKVSKWLWYMNFLLRIVIPTKWIFSSIWISYDCCCCCCCNWWWSWSWWWWLSLCHYYWLLSSVLSK